MVIMNISTDKLINETNLLTYELHIISLINKDTLVLKSLFHYKNNPRIKKNIFKRLQI